MVSIDKRNSDLFVSDKLRQKEIIRIVHKGTGHGSANVMKYIIGKQYFWNGMNCDINVFYDNCEIYRRNKDEMKFKRVTAVKT